MDNTNPQLRVSWLLGSHGEVSEPRGQCPRLPRPHPCAHGATSPRLSSGLGVKVPNLGCLQAIHILTFLQDKVKGAHTWEERGGIALGEDIPCGGVMRGTGAYV